MLAIIRRTIGDHTAVRDFQQGLIIVHHDRPISEIFSPKSCMRGLARAAFRCEQIAHTVHRHNRAVKQYRVIAYHLFRYLAVNCQFFEVAV